MGQPFLKDGYYKIHFYLKCVVLIISLNYFQAQEKKLAVLKKNKGKFFIYRKILEQCGS